MDVRIRVLNIATGIGEPAISTAKICGKNGHVTATDISRDVGDYGGQSQISEIG